MKKKFGIIILVFGILFSMTSCSTDMSNRYSASFLELFDTVTTIVGYADNKEEFTEYSQMIYDYLDEYNRLFDIYEEYDGIHNMKTINDNAGIEPVKVDPIIIDFLLYSKEMYALTDGKVNIAYGAVLSEWHDHRTEGLDDPENATLPDFSLLQSKVEHTDINQLIIDQEASTVYLVDPEMSLDVGAIAKGYAVEKVVEKIKEDGLVNATISVGGNVRSFGLKLNSEGERVPWSVGIQNPDLSSEETTLHILSFSEESLVTSGIYERYYVVDGKQYHHIIDPETLMPADYFVAVSIVCENSGLADALSTAIFNMPYEKGLELIESLDGVESMWVFKDSSEKYSSGFTELIQ